MTSQSPPDGNVKEEYKNAWRSIQHIVMNMGASWSGRERNCVYLNLGGLRFANVSACSDADFLDDSRAAAVVDWDDDGRLDLLLKNRTAPRLRLLRNQVTSPDHFVTFDLKGTRSNRDAIGARVIVELEGRTLRKTLYAGSGYLAQSSKRLHFGLGDATQVAKVSVRWPDGALESFEGLAADTRYSIRQGEGQVRIVPARTLAAYAGPVPEPPTPSSSNLRRAVLVEKLPMGAFPLPAFEGGPRTVSDLRGKPLLINLWASWCQSCLGEFGELRDRREDIERAGLRIVTMTTDEGANLGVARQMLASFGLSEGAGYADGNLLLALEVLSTEVLGRADQMDMPTSLLLDREGQLVTIYLGPVDVDQLLDDVAVLQKMQPGAPSCARLMGGRWLQRFPRDFGAMADVYEHLGRVDLATFYREVERVRSR